MHKSKKEYFWLLCIVLCFFMRLGQRCVLRVDNGYLTVDRSWFGIFEIEMKRLPLADLGGIKVDYAFPKKLPDLLVFDADGRMFFKLPYNFYNAGIEPGRVIFDDEEKLKLAIVNNSRFRKSCVALFPWEIPFLISLVFYGLERRKRIDAENGIFHETFSFTTGWQHRLDESIAKMNEERLKHGEMGKTSQKANARAAKIRERFNDLYSP